jgi:hypothetical protein
MHMRALHRTLPSWSSVGNNALHIEPVFVDILLVARVGNCRYQRLGDNLRALFLA